MTHHYRKADVQFHRLGYGHLSVPAINVKVRHFPRRTDVEEHFKCAPSVAEKALELVFSGVQERFWEDVQYEAREIYGPRAKVYSEGHSDGWLYVKGDFDPNVDRWDAIALARWAKLERWCAAEIAWHTSWACVCSTIEANEWAPADADVVLSGFTD